MIMSSYMFLYNDDVIESELIQQIMMYKIRLGRIVNIKFEASNVFLIFFINVALTWIGYRKPPKLDYCFITSTNLVPVTVCTQI